MQLASYTTAKAQGALELKRYGQSFQIVKRQFDPDTGAETVPATQTFTRAEIQRQRDEHAKALAECDALLTDLDALK